MAQQFTDTPIGILMICAEKCITEIRLVDAAGEQQPSPLTQQAAAQMREYFAGARTAFDLPLDPQGTPFQKRVWEALQAVPFGETVSYGELASRIGCGSAQAVGQAVGRNPILIAIPCHRVLAAHRFLGGFSSGIENKKRLLLLEKISFFM